MSHDFVARFFSFSWLFLPFNVRLECVGHCIGKCDYSCLQT